MSKWYFEINDYCKTLSEVYNVPLIKVSAIFSILSPNTTFKNNVSWVEKFLRTNGTANVSFGNQRKKALNVLKSESLDHGHIMALIGKGLKTRAFFDNIYNPETSQLVTVDLWMARKYKIKGSITNKRYNDIQKDIQEKARLIGVKPHELQAKIWIDIRGKAF